MCGVYLHIPFCKQACSYCDFYFLTRESLIPAFVDALIDEINRFSEHPMADEPVHTLYLGGGTPSLLPTSDLERVFRALDDALDMQPQEITLEMNPDDAEESRLREWKSLGIHRVSMGIQSFDEGILRSMHRAHSREEAIAALELLAKTGFDRFTADLIYGNPGQSLSMLDADLDQLLSFSPPHISAYALMVEEGTRLGKQVAQGRISVPDDEQVASHFQRVQDRLSASGYTQYEVSNFAQPGCEAVHNTNYWKHVNYVGFGPSAHSFYWGRGTVYRDVADRGLGREDVGREGAGREGVSDAVKAAEDVAVRWANVRDLSQYLRTSAEGGWWLPRLEDGKEMPVPDLPVSDLPGGKMVVQERLSLHMLADERIALGLRMKCGITEEELASRYAYTINPKQKDWLKLQESVGTLVFRGGTLALSAEGLSIADHLTAKFLSLG